MNSRRSAGSESRASSIACSKSISPLDPSIARGRYRTLPRVRQKVTTRSYSSRSLAASGGVVHVPPTRARTTAVSWPASTDPLTQRWRANEARVASDSPAVAKYNVFIAHLRGRRRATRITPRPPRSDERGPPKRPSLSSAEELLGGDWYRLAGDLLEVLAAERHERRHEGGDREADSDPEGDLEAARERGGGILPVREQVLRPRRRDRGEHGEPDGAADLLARVDEPGREPRVLAGDAGQSGDRHGDEREPEPDADQQETGQEVAEVGAVRRDLREVREAAAEEAHPDGEDRLHAHPRDERLGDPRGDDGGQCDGQVADAGLQGREAEHLLHVEREQEEHSEHHRPQAEADHVRGRRRPPAEEAERDERRARAVLDPEERGHEDGRACERSDRLHGRPAVVRRLREAVDEEHEAAGHGDSAGGVEVPRHRVRAALTHVARHEGQRSEADGDVDEEDPLPADVLGEHSAREHTDGGPRTGDGAEDAERLVPLRAFLEEHGDDREDGRREHGAGRTLQEPGDDQHLR